MSPKPFIRPFPAMQRLDMYAKMFSDACAMLHNPHTNAHQDPCRLPMNEGIVESQPSSSSDGGVTDNAETENGVSTYQDHKDLDVYVETVKDQSASYDGSTESNNLSSKHDPQETSVESGPRVYRWKPEDWLSHPSSYCKYMETYLYMPLEDDFATIPSSPRPSSREVNGVAPDLLELVEQIEYYFSFDNLIHDVKFRDHMNYHGGWVALPFVASLPEVRELTLNVKVIEEVIKTLSFDRN
ncbi:hypothetical protein QN277_005163 [Acacia crassicarpa]|uniref:HTH La-type RNA-binding domain-containing protein n=1 Tax=Acacia crassicarpa TaxID=499986 RepID=A0AAE1IW02_9FABA|nr:hypothetical protein QN277_005163 [Acacia crassicarpa]